MFFHPFSIAVGEWCRLYVVQWNSKKMVGSKTRSFRKPLRPMNCPNAASSSEDCHIRSPYCLTTQKKVKKLPENKSFDPVWSSMIRFDHWIFWLEPLSTRCFVFFGPSLLTFLDLTLCWTARTAGEGQECSEHDGSRKFRRFYGQHDGDGNG